MTNQMTIQQIMEQCEINLKAINVVMQLEFFLVTEMDRVKFVNEYTQRQLSRSKKPGTVIVDLAREVGSYHYKKMSFDELVSMDEKHALERLFVEPVSVAKLKRVREHAVRAEESFKDGLKRLYEYKIHNPQHSIMKSLLFA